MSSGSVDAAGRVFAGLVDVFEVADFGIGVGVCRRRRGCSFVRGSRLVGGHRKRGRRLAAEWWGCLVDREAVDWGLLVSTKLGLRAIKFAVLECKSKGHGRVVVGWWNSNACAETEGLDRGEER